MGIDISFIVWINVKKVGIKNYSGSSKVGGILIH